VHNALLLARRHTYLVVVIEKLYFVKKMIGAISIRRMKLPN